MGYVYIVECNDGFLYTGITDDVEKRIHQHNHSKKGSKFVKHRRPVVLEHKEPFEDKRQAAKREKEIKGWRREKKIRLIKGCGLPST